MKEEVVAADDGRRVAMSRRTVTLLLATTGAAVGFVLGSATLAFVQIWAPGGFHWRIDIPFGVMLGGPFGSLVGGIGAPVLAWLFMRTVPLGRAIGWSIVATIAGVIAGMLARGHPALGGCAGFVLGAIALWATHRAPTA